MIKITEKKQCSGCFACVTACPLGCISMIPDNEGFVYPKVDTTKCINCDLCSKKCPLINKKEVPITDIPVYSVINKNEEIRKNSSSGGVFSLFAEEIIKNGGVVFGASFSEDFKSVHHISVTKIEDLAKLRGSKYLQSNIDVTYKEAETYLKKGSFVYFSGTPCQITGLYSYLGKDYENLYTQDFICHGVPSPMVWKKYVEKREEIADSKTTKIFFRNKEKGWKLFSTQFDFINGDKYLQDLTEDLYMKGFLSDMYLRPSCHDCGFKTVNRVADITLADFWGIEKTDLNMDDDKGTSLVLLHSEKGKAFFEKIKPNILCKEANLDFAIRCNPAISKSSVPHKNRRKFFSKIKKHSVDDAINSCIKISLPARIFILFKRIVKKLF